MLNITDSLRKIHRSSWFTKALRSVSKRYGENIYERCNEWDVLLILDAAQFRIMRELYEEYDYLESIETMKSRGSHSSEWCYNTFIRDYSKFKSEIDRTHYVSANIISTLVLSGESDLKFVDDVVSDEMIEEYQKKKEVSELPNNLKSHRPVWEDSLHTDTSYIHPDFVTEAGVEIINDMDESEKAILHYMQPHEPFVNAESDISRNWPNSTEARMFNTEEETYKKLMSNYKDNHRFILDELKKLLSKVPDDKSIVISADHGNITNTFFNVRYALGHPNHIFFSRNVRYVPWINVNQADVQSDVEHEQDDLSSDSRDIHEQLESLGYK